MKRVTVGVLAHVDAGKTTLCEALLYHCGAIRSLGRVDERNAYLDNFRLERERGITIFSKQAVLQVRESGCPETELDLLDTPGHVDFSAEMERTLQVLDYAVLIISGTDGIQGHTRTLWKLLAHYHIPTFLFVNKMDRPDTDPAELEKELKTQLSDGCVSFGMETMDAVYETAALCDEKLLETYLEQGRLEDEVLVQLIRDRKLFPCFFGSALKLDGIDDLLQGLCRYTEPPAYGADFGARVYKISRDAEGNRLTHVKLTGGVLRVKDEIEQKSYEGDREVITKEKINQLRIYSGEKYELVQEAEAGSLCVLTGLSHTAAGQGLGLEAQHPEQLLEPVLRYQLILPPDTAPLTVLPWLKELEEEDPALQVVYTESTGAFQIQVMGEVQMEILQSVIRERYGVEVGFGTGDIVYKETIANTVEGVGHFEPLRHYAEAHLILEPAERGSGLEFCLDCSEEVLAKNWQRLILTHLKEREHKGVLTGSGITDMKITVTGGRAHLKHTEGGDFRQATYRAVRQGLMQAESILLEPYYQFVLEVPVENAGRAMTDLEQMGAKSAPPEITETLARLTGTAPVSGLREYPREVTAYTKGQGRLSVSFWGYDVCGNAEQVIEQRAYDPENDLENPSGSVFCAHGSGYLVPWDQVFDYMHTERTLVSDKGSDEVVHQRQQGHFQTGSKMEETYLGTEEIDAILARTYQANQKSEFIPHKGIASKRRRAKSDQSAGKVWEYREKKSSQASLDKYFLVDGYNVIFAWKDLTELARENLSAARGRLLDVLCDYQAMKGFEVIVVFDAYRVQGHPTEVLDYHNIHVVFTAEAETADQYIEKFAHTHAKHYDITVVTSDGLEQIIIRGEGCRLVSAREFEREVHLLRQEVRTEYIEKQTGSGDSFGDALSERSKMQMKELGKRQEPGKDQEHGNSGSKVGSTEDFNQ